MLVPFPLLADASGALPAHLPAYLLLGFAVFLIGVTKSGFGAGTGLIIVPLTTLAMSRLPMGERAALGLLLPLLTAGDMLAVFQYRKLLDARLLRLLAWPTLLGVVTGSLLLLGIHRVAESSVALAVALIRLEIGLECVVLVSLHYYGVIRGIERKLLPELLRSWITGTYAGVSSTLAHAAGPVIALYLLPLRLPREAFVGTCAVYFAALNTAKIPAYYFAGQFAYASVGFTLLWLPLVFIGAAAGRWIVRNVDDKLFGKIIYGSTFAMGLYLITDGLLRLLAAI